MLEKETSWRLSNFIYSWSKYLHPARVLSNYFSKASTAILLAVDLLHRWRLARKSTDLGSIPVVMWMAVTEPAYQIASQ